MLDYNNYLSEQAKLVVPDGIRGLFPLEKPGIVSFLAGKPNPATFPFESVTLHLKPPLGIDLGDVAYAKGLKGSVDQEGNDIKVDEKGQIVLELEGRDMQEALQYGPTAGIPRLVTFLTEFISKVHERPIPAVAPATNGNSTATTNGTTNGKASPLSRPDTPHHPTKAQAAQLAKELIETVRGEPTTETINDTTGSSASDSTATPTPWRLTVGGGCQDLLYKAFQTLLNPGDPILVESPVYAGVLGQFLYLGLDKIDVAVDDQGVSADALRKVLESWPEGKKKPKILYTVPTGSNPTGATSGPERKLEILKLAQEHDLLILEDDPYYFLASERPQSYFELETQVVPGGGRVVRFDSLSKVLSSGMRLGFATGPTPIMKAMDVLTSAANLQPNGMSQAIAYRLLRHWGIKGFQEHSQRVAQFYADRRNQFEAIAKRHLDGIATWVSPVAGMFLWIDVSPVPDTYDLVMNNALAKGVLAIPGFAFMPNGGKTSFVRASFSIVDMGDAEKGFKALGEAIREMRNDLGL
ncbi:hypothetical protein QFC22_005049 [Naganishia vaughanmartiniae]|uniref:Uncharacterized protein n=1 Tax=Naganishia vaughanmartiniae TaxID=1424756 RepID=A0ACC2WXN3_9TREE|nr:hypothetical protein QFC22_005049 [Naganishia vaughanmartiniae]